MKKDLVFISGYAKLPGGISAADIYTSVGIGVLVSRSTGEILEADCTLVTDVGRKFIKSILVGKNLRDFVAIEEDINDNYFGPARKALVSATKKCHEKYISIIEGLETRDY
ncbi:MAG: hypothetical protein AVO33_10250 [delta proteobacterium ML8_F1]|nr:MAG: hypothetical protein AVO33_10250 [delta proteobacterium ML8_F1]